MRRALALICVAAASGQHATSVHPAPVTIPQLTPGGVLAVGKPVLYKHGLIQVETPNAASSLVPSSVAANPTYTHGTPHKGRVVDKTEPTFFCKKEGYVLEGNMCVKTDYMEARFVCPGGFDINSGECSRRTAYLQQCPDGYIAQEGTCAKVVTTASIPVCPENAYEISPGVCERQLPQSLQPSCPEGTFDGTNCIVQVFAEARAFCPEGFSFFDGICIQEETYDCTRHGAVPGTRAGVIQTVKLGPMTPYTGPGTPVIGRQPHSQLRGPGPLPTIGSVPNTNPQVRMAQLPLRPVDQQKPQEAEPEEEPLDEEEAAAPEPEEEEDEPVRRLRRLEGAHVATEHPPHKQHGNPNVRLQPTKTTVSVMKTCTRVTSTALVFACDEGVLQGQRCLIKSPVAPTMVCRHLESDGSCYSTQRVASLSVCPAGYERECQPGGVCECAALEAAAFIQSCPSGFTEADDGCLRTAQANIVCPPGFTLQGESCLRVLREPADCVFSVTYECDHTQTNCAHMR